MAPGPAPATSRIRAVFALSFDIGLPILAQPGTQPGMHDFTPIQVFAATQHGVIHRRQVLAMGFKAYQLARWVRAGRLHRLHPNTFTIPGAPSTWEQALLAALLELGHGALVAGRAAAGLHGFDGFEPGPVVVLVPRRRRRRLAGVSIHTSQRIGPGDRATAREFPCTSAVRTITDLAAWHGDEGLADAIDSALRRGLVSERYLRARLRAMRPGHRGRGCLAAALLDAGGHSWLERRFLGLVRRAGLRRPVCQAVHREGGRFLARTDFTWSIEQVIVEVAGHSRHASPRERQRDAERHTELQVQGWLVLTFTHADVTTRPAWVVEQLRRALALRARPA